ncbi:YraN family protein [Candidatus Bipolaricaulota bacterium]|nr:YraN family protein [Candidatus Bipolaricaulota bacterium]
MEWREAEERACEYLRSLGYLIVARNWRWRGGEVDIIAKDGNTLVFVEVKYRTADRFGLPAEAVDPRKREKLLLAAKAFLGKDLGKVPVRFDVITLLGEELSHLKGAFGEGD